MSNDNRNTAKEELALVASPLNIQLELDETNKARLEAANDRKAEELRHRGARKVGCSSVAHEHTANMYLAKRSEAAMLRAILRSLCVDAADVHSVTAFERAQEAVGSSSPAEGFDLLVLALGAKDAEATALRKVLRELFNVKRGG